MEKQKSASVLSVLNKLSIGQILQEITQIKLKIMRQCVVPATKKWTTQKKDVKEHGK